MNSSKLNRLYNEWKTSGAIKVPEGETLTERNLDKMEEWAKENLRSYDLLLKYKVVTVERHAEEVGKVDVLLRNIRTIRREGING